MTEVRWQRGSGWPLALIGFAVVLVLVTMPGAAVAATDAVTRAPAAVACGTHVEARPGSWYRRVAHADAQGWLRGYTLVAGRPDGTRSLRVRLHAESFVAPPVGGQLVYGTDDGSRSEVRVVRLDDGCDARLLTASHVIRRATLDPSGRTAYLHVIDRRTRADRGIWRRSLVWADELVQVMPGLADPADGPFGRTFLTLFTWSETGNTLAVQSCGDVECRTRLLDTRTGAWMLDGRHGQGELIGLTDTERFGYEACHGLPCPIVAISRDGARRAIADAAGVASSSGERIWYERPNGDGTLSLRAADPARHHDHAVRGPSGRLVWPARWADAAFEAPSGWVAITADGRWTDPMAVRLGRLDADDTLRLHALEEVTR